MSREPASPKTAAADSLESVTRVGNGARGIAYEEPLIFERSRPGRIGFQLAALDVPAVAAADRLGAGKGRGAI